MHLGGLAGRIPQNAKPLLNKEMQQEVPRCWGMDNSNVCRLNVQNAGVDCMRRLRQLASDHLILVAQGWQPVLSRTRLSHSTNTERKAGLWAVIPHIDQFNGGYITISKVGSVEWTEHNQTITHIRADLLLSCLACTCFPWSSGVSGSFGTFQDQMPSSAVQTCTQQARCLRPQPLRWTYPLAVACASVFLPDSHHCQRCCIAMQVPFYDL